jgi:hypothetical protein
MQNRMTGNEAKTPVQEYRIKKWHFTAKVREKGWLQLVGYAHSYRQLNRLIDAVGVIQEVSRVELVRGDYSYIKAQRSDGLED